MKSADFSQRSKAFDEACALLASGKSAPDARDCVKVGIIQLLNSATFPDKRKSVDLTERNRNLSENA